MGPELVEVERYLGMQQTFNTTQTEVQIEHIDS